MPSNYPSRPMMEFNCSRYRDLEALVASQNGWCAIDLVLKEKLALVGFAPRKKGCHVASSENHVR
jgi:hypothetical protein